MNNLILDALLVLAAYLIGSIPFGLLVARWARGIDIRTVGSGNIGATNVGRTLGFRFFVIVFTLDLLKGFGPAFGFPHLATSLTGQAAPTLGVLVALAAILGHNFPVYLRFRGGKGVATSLGALLALDPGSALSAAGGFATSLLVTRFVSVSSLFGGAVFAGVHFARVKAPFGSDQIAMSLLTIALVILLIVRHRKNLARLRAGTEPRVPLGRRKTSPAGKVPWLVVLVLAAAAAFVGLAAHAVKRAELRLEGCTLTEVARLSTGLQRADRLVFADRGRLLAVSCPRYHRVAVYRVDRGPAPERQPDIVLAGRPVAIWPLPDRLCVLVRPPGDARHLEPGSWETFDFQGRRIGSSFRVGFYPDDLAITADGRHALVLTSGRAEGDSSKPLPALTVLALGAGSDTPREVGRVSFPGAGDDPDRLVLDPSGRMATVRFLGRDEALEVDLSDPAQPVVAGRSSGAAADASTVPVVLPGLGRCLAGIRPKGSGLDLYADASHRTLGHLSLLGAMNLSPIRPTGIAVAPEQGLIAIANRSGGVHLIAIQRHPHPPKVAAAESAGKRR